MIIKPEEYIDALTHACSHQLLVSIKVQCPLTKKIFDFPRNKLPLHYLSAIRNIKAVVFVPECEYPYDEEHPLKDIYINMRYYHNYFWASFSNAPDRDSEPKLIQAYVHYA